MLRGGVLFLRAALQPSLRAARRALGVALLCGLSGCATGPVLAQQRPADPPEGAGPDRVACQIVFDAGSSGTRLFVYAQQGAEWREFAGPRSGALADPIRQIRGKTHADLDAVTAEVVALLDAMRRSGPPDRNGRPQWEAFDWPARCRVTDAMVLATAGMRLAEQDDAGRSRELWAGLSRRLRDRVGPDARIQARTLTGFEEAVYAWLAVQASRGDQAFGIAEMGGASAQVAFPCPTCDPQDDAVRTILVRGRGVQMFGHSFLGLGQDEAPRALGFPAACAYGIGLRMSGWTRQACASGIDLIRSGGAWVDPWNFSPQTSGGSPVRGALREIPLARAAVDQWLLTGAFRFMSPQAVEDCCENQRACFQAPTACFRAVYLEKLLSALGIPAEAPRVDTGWTLGAVLCAESACLGSAPPPVCRWLAGGCL